MAARIVLERTLGAAVDEHGSILNKVLWDIKDLLKLVGHLSCVTALLLGGVLYMWLLLSNSWMRVRLWC